MSNSILEIIIRFLLMTIFLSVLPFISHFFTISIGQAFGMSLGMAILDLIVYISRKALKSKKDS
jgi:uncharacterized protein YebE (UPF0316 family)